MNDNLILLINKLSYQIVSRAVEEEDLHRRGRKDDRQYKKLMKRLSQKGCDVLLGKCVLPPLPDPCVTDYGGNWSPLTLMADFITELKAQRAFKSNETLIDSLNCLQLDNYDCVNELLKLLLLLKNFSVKPLKYSKNQIFFSNSDSILSPIESYTGLSSYSYSFSKKTVSGDSFSQRALKYEESWTKSFDSKFHTLGEYSKRNLLMPEMSLKSLVTAKPLRAESQSDCFVFPDYFSMRSFCSEKNLCHSSLSVQWNETSLLDEFVENPITHKLPDLLCSQKSWRSSLSGRYCDQIKRKLQLLPENENVLDFFTENDEVKDISCTQSIIELKRNSNCSHSFSTLYEKSQNQVFDESFDSLIHLKNKGRDKSSKNSGGVMNLSSKEIILGIWETEVSLMKQFRPDLACNMPKLKIISVLEYVEDVKYLLTGINSSTFHLDTEKNQFFMEYGTCLENITPDSLFYFSEEFLEIGNYYVKLQDCVSKNVTNNFDTCATISQAFWKSIFDFLELHYSVILEIPLVTNLIALKFSTRDIHEMMTTIAEICKISEPDESLPEGGELLNYLLEILGRLNKSCSKNIVFGILQNCCNVYFMCTLQTWMFKGHLHSQNNFFVDYHRQNVKMKSRNYYKSFYIAHEKVPTFLRGYEESIYNCGKSIHFLKLFNPEDKFCQLLEKADYPRMHLCLSDERLEELEKEFRDYEVKVKEVCGERVSIISLRKEKKEKERALQELLKKWQKIQERKRELSKQQEHENLKLKKDMQNQLLNEQWSIVEADKKMKKLREEEERKMYEAVEAADSESDRIMIEKKKLEMAQYYDTMLKNIEAQLISAEQKKKKLLDLLKSAKVKNMAFTDGDLGKEIEQTDTEGNITQIIDINSNSFPSENAEEVIKPEEAVSVEEFDENLNPSVKLSNKEVCFLKNNGVKEELSISDFQRYEGIDDVEKERIQRSISYQTFASKEALRNKNNVLKWEFRLMADDKSSDSSLQESSSFGTESHIKNLLSSELSIRTGKKSDSIMLKKVLSKTQISLDNKVNSVIKIPKVGSGSTAPGENLSVLKVGLENVLSNKISEDFEVGCYSSDSLMTPVSDSLTEESSDLTSEPRSEEVIDSRKKSDSKAIVLNENYLSALDRDSKISEHRLSFQEVFQSLKKIKMNKQTCTDFMKFQRFLKRSVLVPLKIQEKLANDALLKHLLLGENLISHLKSLRSYYFLNDGEFGRSFTYNIFRSLAKCKEPQQFFERSNLSNIVNEALNYTIHSCEPNAHNLSFQIVKMPQFLNHASHDVLSPFELSYKVDWPLSIIITEKALKKYKVVFKFLLKLKRINWTLNENFLFLNHQFKNKNLDRKVIETSSHYHMIQIFRHAITQVMITLDDYIFSNGIQCPWIFFMKDLETTENIDHLYQKHVRYIKDVLMRCFQSKCSEDLLSCLHDLIELALKFHYTSKSSVFEMVNGQYVHPKFHVLKETFNEFCSVMKVFLGTLKRKIAANQVLKSHYILIEKFSLKLM